MFPRTGVGADERRNAYGAVWDVAASELSVSRDGLGLDAWFDEPYYKAAKGSLSTKGAFILRKLMKHDGSRFVEVMADLYRDDAPDPQDITKLEWQTILAYMGASPEKIADGNPRTNRQDTPGLSARARQEGLEPTRDGP